MRAGTLRQLTDAQLLREVEVQQRACEDSVVDVWADQADRNRNKACAEVQRRGGFDALRVRVAGEPSRLAGIADDQIVLRLLNRHKRMIRLLETPGMPPFVVRNERRLIEEAYAEWHRRHGEQGDA